MHRQATAVSAKNSEMQASKSTKQEKSATEQNQLSTLKCYYTNADSLSNKKNELSVVISSCNPDIVIITEILPKNYDTRPSEEEFVVKNYSIYSNLNDCNCSRGVCILVNNRLKSIRKTEGLPNIVCGESVWCEIKLKSSDVLLVGGLYRSPNSSATTDSNINSFVSQLRMPTHTLICGDFNYPEINWCSLVSSKSDEHKASKFLNSIQDSFLFQHVTQPTHYRANQEPTTINLILTNEENMVSQVDYGPPLGLSHHCGVHFNYSCYSELDIEFSKPILMYKYYAGDYDGMQSYVENCKLLDKLPDCSTEEAWNLLDNTLSAALEKYVPAKLVRSNTKASPPWMNAVIKEKSKQR